MVLGVSLHHGSESQLPENQMKWPKPCSLLCDSLLVMLSLELSQSWPNLRWPRPILCSGDFWSLCSFCRLPLLSPSGSSKPCCGATAGMVPLDFVLRVRSGPQEAALSHSACGPRAAAFLP